MFGDKRSGGEVGDSAADSAMGNKQLLRWPRTAAAGGLSCRLGRGSNSAHSTVLRGTCTENKMAL